MNIDRKRTPSSTGRMATPVSVVGGMHYYLAAGNMYVSAKPVTEEELAAMVAAAEANEPPPSLPDESARQDQPE
jgi:hypothetical protein